MNKKAQVFTIDLLISLSIFILIFASVIVFLFTVASISNPYSSYYAQIASSSLSSTASAGANTLIGSQGLPINWPSAKCSAIMAVGILYNSYEAFPQKLYNLTTLPSGCLSALLDAGNSFNISASYLNGSRLKVNGVPITAGFQIPSNPTYLASIQRFIVLYPGTNIIRITYSEWLV